MREKTKGKLAKLGEKNKREVGNKMLLTAALPAMSHATPAQNAGLCENERRM